MQVVVEIVVGVVVEGMVDVVVVITDMVFDLETMPTIEEGLDNVSTQGQ